MKVMKWSAIALAVSAGSTQFAVADAFVSDQAEAKGFIEDSSLDLLLRNYYFNRDGKSGSGDRVDWTQGFLTTYESGFTQGTVGFGVDAFGYSRPEARRHLGQERYRQPAGDERRHAP